MPTSSNSPVLQETASTGDPELPGDNSASTTKSSWSQSRSSSWSYAETTFPMFAARNAPSGKPRMSTTLCSLKAALVRVGFVVHDFDRFGNALAADGNVFHRVLLVGNRWPLRGVLVRQQKRLAALNAVAECSAVQDCLSAQPPKASVGVVGDALVSGGIPDAVRRGAYLRLLVELLDVRRKRGEIVGVVAAAVRRRPEA